MNSKTNNFDTIYSISISVFDFISIEIYGAPLQKGTAINAFLEEATPELIEKG
jgi:hypothetical protein